MSTAPPESDAPRAGFVAGLRDAVTALPTARRNLLIGVGLAVALGLGWIVASGGGSGEMRAVARGMVPEDTQAAIAAFTEKSIPHELGEHGTLMVPSEHIHEARLALAVGTMPSGRTVGFELFDESDMGRSAFNQKVNYHRALEGELGRTIRHINGIERARVHLVIPARRVFRELDVEPSASVIIGLKPTVELSSRQAAAIRQLVAGAVERLEPRQVAIVDQHGTMLARPDTDDFQSTAHFDQKTQLEKQLENRVLHLLEPVVGAGKVRAQVAMEIDYSRFVETTETFDPEGQVVRSEREQLEKSNSTKAAPGGAPGTASNLPRRNAGASATAPQSNSEKSDVVKNYDIDRKTVRTENPSPRVKRISIAVLVDEKLVADGADGLTTPRTEAEVAQYATLVSSALGLNTKRGDQIEVASVKFAPPLSLDDPDETLVPPVDPLQELMPLIAAGAGALVLLLGAFIWWSRRRRKRREAEAAVVEANKLELVIDDSAEPDEFTDGNRRERIEKLQARAKALAGEDLRRLAVVFERWFESDAELEAAEAAAPDSSDEEAA